MIFDSEFMGRALDDDDGDINVDSLCTFFVCLQTIAQSSIRVCPLNNNNNRRVYVLVRWCLLVNRMGRHARAV